MGDNMKVYIILRKFVFRIDLDTLSLPNIPSPDRIVEFQQQRLPIGMGTFSLDSKLYLTGGEMLLEDADLTNGFNSGSVLDMSYEHCGLNSAIYMLQPDAPIPFTTKHGIQHMNKPKTNPQVAKVDGKVYILSSYPHCMRDDDFAYPAPFECYDPPTNSWEVLPEPPNFTTDVHSHYIRSFFVLGTRIYMRNRYGIQFYDVVARKWYDRNAVSREQGQSFYSNMMACVSVAEGANGLAVAYELEEGLVGYIYATDRTVKSRQSLEKINVSLPHPKVCNEGFVYHMGGGKFYYILSAEGHDVSISTWLVYVTIFEVKVGVDGDGFLETLLLRPHIYDFDSLISFSDYKKIQNVVFMGDHSNRASRKRSIGEMAQDAVLERNI